MLLRLRRPCVRTHSDYFWEFHLEYSQFQANKMPMEYLPTAAHCSVSSNSFHGQITQKAVHQISDPENKKCSHWFFLEQTTLKTCGFWAGEALEAWTWDYLNITLAQKWHSAIFQFSAEKSFPACQKGSCTFLSNLGVVICKNHVVRPLHSFKKYRKFLFSSLETFFCRNLENVKCHFWANVMLR